MSDVRKLSGSALLHEYCRWPGYPPYSQYAYDDLRAELDRRLAPKKTRKRVKVAFNAPPITRQKAP